MIVVVVVVAGGMQPVSTYVKLQKARQLTSSEETQTQGSEEWLKHALTQHTNVESSA